MVKEKVCSCRIWIFQCIKIIRTMLLCLYIADIHLSSPGNNLSAGALQLYAKEKEKQTNKQKTYSANVPLESMAKKQSGSL